MTFFKNFFKSSIFRIFTITLIAILVESSFFILALNTNLSPKQIVVIGILLGATAGIIGAFLYSMPFIKALRTIQNAVDSHSVKFEKTGMYDVDIFINYLNNMSLNSVDIFSKLSSILDLSGRNMALFEVYDNSGKVYITKQLFPMLNDPDVSLYKTKMISLNLFNERMDRLEKCLVPAYSTNVSCTYQIDTSRSTSRWIRLTTLRCESSTIGLVEDISCEMLNKSRMEFERDYDILTSLLNRRAFLSSVKKIFEEPEKLKIAAMLSIDLDKLKVINDSFGHDYGDEYIRTFANILNSSLPKDAILSRFGGDEFAVFLYGFSSKEEIKHEIIKLNIAISNTSLRLSDASLMNLSASSGIAWYPEDAKTIDVLLKYADFAMYSVKNGTRGAVAEFNVEDYNNRSENNDEANLLNEFFMNRDFEYHFKPIASTIDGEILGYESVIQPNHPKIPNEAVLRSLAKTELDAYKLQKFIVEESLIAFEKLPDRGDFKLFINSVPNQAITFEDYKYISEKFSGILANVVIQTNDSANFSDVSSLKSKRIKSIGGAISLDGYGVEEYGEELLNGIRPLYLKLDISLTQSIMRDVTRRNLVESLISSAHQKEIFIIADDLKKMENMNLMVDMGVDYVEGDLVGKPSVNPPTKLALLSARLTNKNSSAKVDIFS